jgi:ribosomal peptide maturation radical SAM protein 1
MSGTVLESSNNQSTSADLLLISMPFGPQVLQPSLGLSLLNAAAKKAGISSKVLYFTLKFAAKIGLRGYGDVAYSEPTVHGFAGEWVFSGALFQSAQHDIDGYVKDILLGESPSFREARDNVRPASEEVIQTVLDLRSRAAGFIEECLESVLAYRPRMVGFTSTFQQQIAALALARRIKEEAPDVTVVLGGANCEGVMSAEIIRQFKFVDAVVSGEGDLVFPDLVKRVLSGQPYDDIQGINTRKNVSFSRLNGARFSTAPMVHDMDALPYPDFDDFFEQFAQVDLGVDRERIHPRIMFESSRGCWWGEKSHCTFCGLNGSTLTFRAKSERRAMDELLALHERFPASAVSVTDNILDMRYFRNFVPELASRKIGVELFYEVKANLKKEQIRQLRDAGILDIQPGIESFSDHVLGLMRKGVKGLQNIQLLKWCKEYSVRPHWNMLWGFPGEHEEDYAKVAELMPHLYHLPPAGGGGLIRLDRFSPNFNNAESIGFVDVAPYPAYSYIYPFPKEVIANLAYFFTFRYKEPRNVQGYIAPIRKSMIAWSEAYETTDLFFVDKGKQLLIWDLRPLAVTPLTVIDGALREIYLACDAICSTTKLKEIAAHSLGHEISDGELHDLLGPLLERHLILEDRLNFLALAIPLGEYSPPPRVLKRFEELLRGMGRVSNESVSIPIPAYLLKKQPLPYSA